MIWHVTKSRDITCYVLYNMLTFNLSFLTTANDGE